jgi:hypothetical protein
MLPRRAAKNKLERNQKRERKNKVGKVSWETNFGERPISTEKDPS